MPLKSPRNRSLDTPLSEGGKNLARCVNVEGPVEDIDALLDHTVCGDFFTVAPFLPAGCVDLLIADPPYNLDKQFQTSRFRRMSKEDYTDYTRRWLSLTVPLLKPTASIYVCCDWESSLVIGSVLEEFFHVRNRITWQREKGRGAKSNWKNALEDIWFATCGKDYTFHTDPVKLRRRVIAPYRQDGKPKDWEETEDGKFRDTFPSNFWDDITIPFWSMPENTPHPTQKPEKLIAKLILASSNPGDLVFDPFLGSGTASVVARKLERHYLGVESEAQYCVWAEQRLERAKSDKAIQGYTDGVFWERNAKPSVRTRKHDKESQL